MSKQPYKMEFDIGTIKHLGLQMYSTLPPVIGETVANSWDADADWVKIEIPTEPMGPGSEITVIDNGCGMSDSDVRNAYVIVGRDRRKEENNEITPKHNRKIMGRKGIGKFCAFGIANEIEVETVKGGQSSRLALNYEQLEKNAKRREILLPALDPTGAINEGTKVTLREFKKFKTRRIPIDAIRRGLARRFSVIGASYKFEVIINNQPITPEERDLKRLLDLDDDGKPYLWEFDGVEIKPGTGWKVCGWIGALNRTAELEDGIQRGIVIMARGKLVQEPFMFDTTVGQQFALSYLVGELTAEFVDEVEDTIGTTRNQLVWDTEANTALKEWGQKELKRIARQWAEKRRVDNEKALLKNPLYQKFTEEADRFEDSRVKKIADKLIRQVVGGNVVKDPEEQEPVIQLCLDYMEFDSFQELARELEGVELTDATKLIELFREWEVVEAKEMMRVTEGRITTIQKLEDLIKTNALEVPTLHRFLKEFPWVLDPHWNLIADEKTYSDLLRGRYPEDPETPEEDRRIDFLCVSESSTLVVVEIKRPRSKASKRELLQIEEYVFFMRDHVKKTTDPAARLADVVGYLLCGDLADTHWVRGKRNSLQLDRIFVRLYADLLKMVKSNHREFLSRYSQLRRARARRQGS
ncbi:MAG: ATP-binding protein [Acidobacteriia bacterium]|nr:ATP-binding protein [Terriglobia bacterium]